MQSPDTILFFEPDILVRAPLAGYLRECGFQVIEAVSVSEARVFLAKVEEIDLALLNATAEGAFEIARLARSTHPELTVLLMPTVAKAVDEAANPCGGRPQPTEHHQVVLRRIRAAIERRRSRAAQVEVACLLHVHLFSGSSDRWSVGERRRARGSRRRALGNFACRPRLKPRSSRSCRA